MTPPTSVWVAWCAFCKRPTSCGRTKHDAIRWCPRCLRDGTKFRMAVVDPSPVARAKARVLKAVDAWRFNGTNTTASQLAGAAAALDQVEAKARRGKR